MSTDKKRRKFIQATLMTPLAVSAAEASGRLHGMPASLNPVSGAAIDIDKFILPLAHAGIPAEALTDLSRVSALIESVLTDEDDAAEFFVNPGLYFEKYGLDGSEATLVDPAITMLVALTDPAVKVALKNKNYTLLFDYMKASGVFEPRDPSVLKGLIQKIIAENIGEIREAIKAEGGFFISEGHGSHFMEILKTAGVAASEEDLAAVAYLLSPGEMDKISSLDYSALKIFLVVLVVVVVAVIAVVVIDVAGAEQPRIESSIFDGKLMKLDPVALRNMRRIYRISEITQDGQIQLHARREAIREEVTVMFEALLELKLIEISRRNVPSAIDAVYRYACKAAGVPSHVH